MGTTTLDRGNSPLFPGGLRSNVFDSKIPEARWQRKGSDVCDSAGGPGGHSDADQIVTAKQVDCLLAGHHTETFPVALGRYDFLHWFHGRLVSGEEGIRKPFPEIYRKLIDRFSILPPMF